MYAIRSYYDTLELYEASSKEELLGSIDRVLSENSFEKLVDELTAVAEDRMFEFEGLNRTLTGKEINVLIKSSIPHDCGNTWNQVFLSIHDLTRRIRSEKEKLRLEAQLRHRITSYNVCYTKLLRSFFPGIQRFVSHYVKEASPARICNGFV